MKKLSCILIDDEPLAHKILSHYCTENGLLDLKDSFLNAKDALEYLKETKVELIFLDVNMPEVDGFSFIGKLDYKPAIILTTAHSTHAVKSYEYDVVDFLVKPVRIERFNEAVQKAINLYKKNIFRYQQNQLLSVKSKGDLVDIPMSEILYVQSIANYVKIFTRKNSYLLHITTREIEKKLNQNNFTRIHKSYIINLNYLKKVEPLKVLIENTELPVGKTYVKFLGEKLKEQK